ASGADRHGSRPVRVRHARHVGLGDRPRSLRAGATLDSVDVYELLSSELGGDRVLRDEAALESYGRDESELGPYPPDAAVLVESRAEIEIALRLASEHRIPVTPRGAGSGMTGGALPVRGGLVLSTERMRAIKEIDAESLVAVVEPGVITGEFQTQV